MTLKKILPDLIAIVAFILISFAYFFPADIEGRILFQHDTSAGTGAGQEAKVYKEETPQGTTSHMQMLTPNERITEIAQMLSGSDVSDAAIQNAKELLKL